MSAQDVPSPSRRARVPSLRRLPTGEAEKQLVALGLRPRIETFDNVEEVILDQDPEPGTEVAGGSMVELKIGLEAVVPDFADMTLADAEALAYDAGGWSLMVDEEGEHSPPAGFGADTKVKGNCGHNLPGTRRATGGEVGVTLDSQMRITALAPVVFGVALAWLGATWLGPAGAAAGALVGYLLGMLLDRLARGGRS